MEAAPSVAGGVVEGIATTEVEPAGGGAGRGGGATAVACCVKPGRVGTTGMATSIGMAGTGMATSIGRDGTATSSATTSMEFPASLSLTIPGSAVLGACSASASTRRGGGGALGSEGASGREEDTDAPNCGCVCI